MRALFFYFSLAVITMVLAMPALIAGLLAGPRAIQAIGRFWAGMLLSTAGVKLLVQGRENLPLKSKPCIFMSNHQSLFDIPAMLRAVDRPLRMLSKKELFYIPFFGQILRLGGHIRIDRQNRERAIRSVKRAAQLLKQGDFSLAVFVEGTRTRDGKLREFKKGPFHLALEAGLPIVPVVISGAFEILKRRSWKLKPGTLRLQFLPSLEIQDYKTREELSQTVRTAMLGAVQS